MKYTNYPGTDKKVSVVGFGGLRFDLEKSDEENAQLILYAYEQGINYFDTAPGYCDDRSEKIFGIAFRKLYASGKKDFYVSTKSKPKMCPTKESVIEAVKHSLEVLGVPKINFYHVWCIREMSHYELCMEEGGQYEGLLWCQEQGLIDHLCFSSHQPGEEVIKVLDEHKFIGVTMGINLLNFSYRWAGVQYAYDHGYGVVAMNPLSGGTIPAHEKELAFLAEPGETATQAALRFNIASPQITISLVGFNNKRDVDEACRIADEGKAFTEADLERIKLKFQDDMKEICTGCGYCRVCPQGINIPGYMLLYNEKQMFHKTEEEMVSMAYGLEYYNYSANTVGRAADCIACGLCERECTQHLPIIERLKENARWESMTEDTVTV
ncbi:aldo/keto reductase [Lachnospiraceae bacterium OttesenSCG-928-J05]|nr:aldo/keto reductase [Lachnospiraceae bacterium OttesenSCG-928-J05]